MVEDNFIFHKCDEKNWTEFLTKRDSGKLVQIDQEMFDYWQELLPPITQSNSSFYFAEGFSPIIHFFKEEDETGRELFYCQSTLVKNKLQ